jgi:Pel9A-like, right handed beta helix region
MFVLSLPAACSGDDGGEAKGGSGAGGGSGTGGTGGSSGGGSSSGGDAGAGGGSPTTPPSATKFDILGAGANSELHEQICASAGQPSGCDVCDALGFWDDWECDDTLIAAGLCAGTDPDCSPRNANYYVATDGDDANDGSETAPFATIQRAHDAAEAGDLIYLRGGTYHPTASTKFTKAGTAGAPIVLQAYPGEVPIIDASNLPEGDVDGGSTPTWDLDGAKHWQLRGPLHLTMGRGAGVMIQEDTQNIDFVQIESSYNGQSASRAGHGFSIIEDEWADAENVRFINCDAHHNANHRARSGEDLAENQYQHGDGWRIKSGKNVTLTGCRSWNNLDDGYDLVWAAEPVVLYNCWAAYTGYDDAAGSITGTPGWAAEWGEGIKLGYTDDAGRHAAIRCLSWGNVHLGFRMDGGPNELLNCASYQNGRRALGWDLGTHAHVIRNSLDFDTLKDSTIPDTTISEFNTWDEATGVTVEADDFLGLDDSAMLGPRTSDGSLPITPFLRLAPSSDLVDAGMDVGLFSSGTGPDLGCFERP